MKDKQRISSKFIFFGPYIPEPPTEKGFKFPDDEAEKEYPLFKRAIAKLNSSPIVISTCL